ncbi:MAG: ORF6N domain-containing protein [Chitinophagaceae bacterium]|nr:ORF6N domain-containing protein [Chitinophagaceae bacterium]
MSKEKKNIKSLLPDETIIRKIYVIRVQKVMLDFDLAVLYDVETKALNQAVKRNIDRFPEDFMLRLTSKEWLTMRSQIVTASPQIINLQPVTTMRSQFVTASQKKRNIAITPYAFTEHGITMLASVLKSERAVKMSIAVVRAFIELKKAALEYSYLADQIQTLRMHLGNHDVQLNTIYEAIENLLDDKTDKKVEQEMWANRKRIGFKTD